MVKYTLWLILLFLELLLASLLWAGNTHAPTGDVATEQRAWWGDALIGGYVVAAPAGLCQHTTSASTSTTISPCRAYALNTGTPRQLEYIEDLALRTVNYTGGAGTYWLVVHAAINEVVSGWTRVTGTHYLWRQSGTQPSLPNRASWLLSATVSGSAITAVTDLRSVGSPVTSTFVGLTDTPDTYAGQAGRTVRVNAGETGLEFSTGTGTDDQTAAEVPFTPTGSISATNVQAAIVEVAAEAGTSTATGTLTTIEVNDSIVTTNVVRLDFLGVDFDCLESPSAEVNCSIDQSITRDTELTAHNQSRLGVHGITDTNTLLTTSHIGQSIQAFDSDLTDLANNQYPAIKIPFTPTATISASNVQAAIEEVVFESAGTLRTIKLDNVQMGGATITTLDFLGADFDCLETPLNEVNCSIDQTIARDSDVTSAIAAHAGLTQGVHGIPVGATLVTSANIGVTVQGFDSDLSEIANNSYPALKIPFTATGTISATNVQDAIAEVAAEAGTSEATGTLSTIQVDEVNVSTGVAVLDLLGSDFDCAEAPAGEVNCSIDASITRQTQFTAHTAATTSVHGIANTANLLLTSSIGSTVQAFDSDLTEIANNTYPAAKIPFTPAGTISATNVQDAIVEAAAEGGGGGGGTGTLTTIKENNVQLGGASIVALDFFGADFDCTEGPTNEINCSIAPALARDTEITAAISTHAGVTAGVHGIPVGATVLSSANIGSTVQAFDADLSEIANNTYAAAKIPFAAGGTVVATNVQAAITEVAAEALPLAGGTLTGALTTSNLGITFPASNSNPLCTTGTYTLFANESEESLFACNNGFLVALGQGTATLQQVRQNNNVDSGATSAAVAPQWGGATSRCRIYEDPTLGATIECFQVSTGTILTFDELIYNGDPKRTILHNAGARDVCLTMDDTGLQTYAAVENCGKLAGTVTTTGPLVTQSTVTATGGAIDFGAATSFRVPQGAAPTTTAVGQIAADNNAWATNRGALQHYDGTANTYVVATQTTSTPSNGQVPTFNTGGTVTWQTPVAPTGSDTVMMPFHCLDTVAGPTSFLIARDSSDSTCNGAENGGGSPATRKTELLLPWNGVADSMVCDVGVAPGAGQSVTLTVRFNGVPTDLSVVISGTSLGPAMDTTASTAYTAGQRITVSHVTSAGAANVSFTNCSVVIRRS